METERRSARPGPPEKSDRPRRLTVRKIARLLLLVLLRAPMSPPRSETDPESLAAALPPWVFLPLLRALLVRRWLEDAPPLRPPPLGGEEVTAEWWSTPSRPRAPPRRPSLGSPL